MRGILLFLILVLGIIVLSANGIISLRKFVEPISGSGTTSSADGASILGNTPPPREEKQTYYQYIDASGSVRFATSLDEIPPQWRSRAGRIEMAGPPPSTPGEARSIRDARANRILASRRPPPTISAQPNITIYTTKTCGVCTRALAYLDRKGIPYVNKDINEDNQARDEFRAKGGNGVPLIDVDGETMSGFNQSRLEKMLAKTS